MRMQNVRFIKPNSLFHPKESSTLISTIIDYLFEIHPMLDKVYVCCKVFTFGFIFKQFLLSQLNSIKLMKKLILQ